MRSIILGKVDKILKTGYFLSDIGVNNWALPFDKALNALLQFEKWEIPVVGGDVCELKDGIFQYNYDNWYCEQKDNESHQDFVVRSIEKAKSFIINYKIQNADRISFVFVLDTEFV